MRKGVGRMIIGHDIEDIRLWPSRRQPGARGPHQREKLAAIEWLHFVDLIMLAGADTMPASPILR
jgi:hypothetical protein